MSELIENSMDEPQKSKGPIQAFFDKWMIVIACYLLSVSFFSIDMHFVNRHYPELSELTHFAGGLEEYSVVDSFKNHRITMKLMTGDTFYFYKVDFFPSVKNALARGKQIDVWVDGSKKPEIWQIAINNKTIMSREALVGALKERNSSPFRASIYLFLAGSLFTIMLKSKNKFISEKLYPATVAIIGLVASGTYFYLVFFGTK